MLPKKKRLTTKEFNRFFVTSKRFHSPHITLMFTPHPTFHASVVVGKKVFKRAVDRNRLRRQLYSTVYNHQPQSGVYIIVAKSLSKKVDSTTLRFELQELLHKIESSGKSR